MKAAPQPRTKVLRIAVVLDGLVCDEVHQSQPGPVSFGSDYRSDVMLFGGRAPLRHTMFDYRQGRYFLDLPAAAKGKLSLGNKTITISALRQQYGGGDRVRVVLDPRAKGKLVIGESTILFQFAEPKPVPPKAIFPAEYAIRLRDQFTPLDRYTFASSAAVLGSFFVYQANQERKDDMALDTFDERFQTAMGLREDEKKPEPELEDEKKDDLAEEDEEKVEEKDKPKPEPKVLKDKPEKFSEKAMAEARSVGVARVLGTWGGPGEGTVFDVINSTENNLGELFQQGMTTTVLADGGDISPFVPGGTGISASGAAVQTEGFNTGEGPDLVAKADKLERKVAGVTKASNTDVFGDVDKTSIKAAIKHRTSALQHCYNKALRTQPDLAGKMSFAISISVMGTVTKVDVEEDSVGSQAVTTCARAKIQGWRFPMDGAEEGADVTFSVVFSGGG
ncbi:MAG: AgmX/PglI C-terminal domain-containing protein [Deltaproteobacteria bacterium]|nr:AgmX/PglI C-terminal domain-containing protein [Deltaproteobacteria bacterium]